MDSILDWPHDRVPADHEDAAVSPFAGRNPGACRVYLAERNYQPGARASAARKPGAREGTFRGARVPRVPLDGRGLERDWRNVCREPEPRGRKGKLRLRRALGAR